MAESKAEELYLGASHVDKIGSTVVVDIEGEGKVATVGVRGGLCGPRKNRAIITGVLHGTEDNYAGNGDVESTNLTIGAVTVFIEWADEPNVSISVVTN
ncbi:hypothetical protein SEA_KRADAL_318 [Streptomyces phage Kradal]|nr:hypothetical protein SEA_KRADAL_318 [Streptomyces phage Kradal]QPL14626.1 hypothetical protein SEA_EHYELIMAYOE_321 [Streptomyces phage EhyElimayoE]